MRVERQRLPEHGRKRDGQTPLASFPDDVVAGTKSRNRESDDRSQRASSCGAPRTGSHIIFSTAHQRVWIACKQCHRWNLPEQQTAGGLLAECERVFDAVGEISVARDVGQVRIGDLRLTRIGAQSPTLFLSARHTQRISKRTAIRMHLGMLIGGVAAVASAAGAMTIGGATGFLIGSGGFVIALLLLNFFQQRRPLTIRLASGDSMAMSRGDAARAELSTDGSGWLLRFPSMTGVPVLRGTDALSALARIIPLFQSVSSTHAVSGASQLLEAAPSTDAAIARMATETPASSSPAFPFFFLGSNSSIWHLPQSQRLALEMIATEQHEQRQLQQEAELLYQQFRDASEIADIMDAELPLHQELDAGPQVTRPAAGLKSGWNDTRRI